MSRIPANADIPPKDYENMVRLSRKYAARSFSYITADDLLQEACIAYVKGRAYYEPEKSDYYMGFIYKRVIGAMLDYIAKVSHNGSSTVRNSSPKDPVVSVVSLDVVADFSVASGEDLILAHVDAELLFDRFELYITDLTDLERQVLVHYFVDRESMVKIGERYGISRLKVRNIIKTCLVFLRKKYDYNNVHVNYRELSRP